MGGIGVIGRGHPGIITAGSTITFESFEDVPTVILSAWETSGLIINLFPTALADISQKKVAGQPVE